MASQSYMSGDVTGHAQQADVADIIGQPLHLLNGSASLDGYDVVAVNARRDEALLGTLFAQPASPSPHLYLHASLTPPPLIIQQSLVSWVSAHRLEVWVLTS